MTTILYDKNEQKIIGRFPNGYHVNGEKPELPNHIIECEVQYENQPVPDQTQYVERSRYVNLENKKYVFGWELIDKTAEQIEKERQIKEDQREKELLLNELKSTSPVREDLDNPMRVAVLEKRIEKLEHLILELL